MSKLESFIRRMTAQRDCLNHAAQLIKNLPGIIFEFGLGNGRTYDHLRQIMPDRDIYVFDRKIACFPSCTPAKDHMFVGEIIHNLPKAAKLFGKKVALIHFDLGTSDATDLKKTTNEIASLLNSMMLSGAIVISNSEVHVPGWIKISEPPGVKQGRYFLYQVL
ncbi:MAG: class I SAM-dependent methyltransferase [Desulfobacula sp.]|nr:class I SAM-dependent methyltransferase [Desulfobacula sp.]